ncbi:MAG: leucine-rich repeat domain-containing protein, partial [Oscillospiraceae bacterium]|nr:leucine-rich repeat domain-containing protein [Oscillospiraceae bacterium]
MKNDSALWQCPACETLNEGGEVCAACGLSRAEADELLRRQSARPGSRKQQNGQNQQSGRNPQNAQPTGRNQQPAPAKKKNGLVAVLAVALVASLAVGGFFAWKAFGSGDGDTDGGRKEKTESTAEQTGGDEANSTDGDRAENPTEPPAETPAPQVEGDWNWSLENGVLTISGTGNMKKFQFAEAPWYGREEEIQSIVIESGVTGVGNWAFYYCDSLTSVTIPDSVTSIGDYAFWGCHSLTSVTIPDGMTIIGTGAFGGCRSLQQVQVSEGNRSFCSIDGVLFSRGRKTILCYPGGRAGAAYAVPDDVTGIGDRAFDCCYGLTSITIPDSVTSIGEVAFHECRGLTSVTIPDSVT